MLYRYKGIMKKLALFLFLFALVGTTAVSGLYYLARFQPFAPDHQLYTAQSQLALHQLSLINDPALRVDYAFKLLERRQADLDCGDNEAACLAAIAAFDLALNETLRCLNLLPAETQAELYGRRRFQATLSQSCQLLERDTPLAQLPAWQNLLLKLTSLRLADSVAEALILMPIRLAGELIPFLGLPVNHDLFPLTGGHADLDCFACHDDGRYRQTRAACDSCHQLPANGLYPDHFGGDCLSCHSTDNWTPTQFDHVAVFECESCHATAVTGDHYPGNCTLCHADKISWQSVKLDHAQVAGELCQTCHQPAEDAGADHYPDLLCEECHISVSDWQVVAYDHEGETTCAGCHAAAATADHYAGVECERCHQDVADWTAAPFDHLQAADCRSCHVSAQPAAHYAGQCSRCHSYSPAAWQPTQFDHTGFNDCQSCHRAEQPILHYPGLCRGCHTAAAWQPSLFTHTEQTENCNDCHLKDTPWNHYAGRCANCHTTASWRGAWMNHDGYTDCQSCHALANHYAGPCSGSIGVVARHGE